MPERVTMGQVSGVYGVRGWVRVRSDCEPLEQLLAYSPWQLRTGTGWCSHELADGKAHGPGLVGSLLVGVSTAKALSYAHRVPLLGVNHLEAHIRSVFLDHPGLSFPMLSLVVSGGHTSIYLSREEGRYEIANLEPSDYYTIYAFHKDFCPEQGPNVKVDLAGPRQEPNIILRTGAIVSGTVTDEQGAAVSRAELTLDVNMFSHTPGPQSVPSPS